jgi:hypothetical protein
MQLRFLLLIFICCRRYYSPNIGKNQLYEEKNERACLSKKVIHYSIPVCLQLRLLYHEDACYHDGLRQIWCYRKTLTEHFTSLCLLLKINRIQRKRHKHLPLDLKEYLGHFQGFRLFLGEGVKNLTESRFSYKKFESNKKQKLFVSDRD